VVTSWRISYLEMVNWNIFRGGMGGDYTGSGSCLMRDINVRSVWALVSAAINSALRAGMSGILVTVTWAYFKMS
jgi:hypothetical protein